MKEELSWHAEFMPQKTCLFLSGVASEPLLQAAGDRENIGLLLQPRSSLETQGRLQRVPLWAADNGCYTAGDNFDPHRWLSWLKRLPLDGCLFAALPDKVADPETTFRRSKPFVKKVKALGFPVAWVAQDGVEDRPDLLPWDDIDCLFIGGTTEWKLSDAVVELGREARRRGLWTHVGRVNSWKRMEWSARHGFDSVDGTYALYHPENYRNIVKWADRLHEEHYLFDQEWREGGLEVR